MSEIDQYEDESLEAAPVAVLPNARRPSKRNDSIRERMAGEFSHHPPAGSQSQAGVVPQAAGISRREDARGVGGMAVRDLSNNFIVPHDVKSFCSRRWEKSFQISRKVFLFSRSALSGLLEGSVSARAQPGFDCGERICTTICSEMVNSVKRSRGLFWR